jgi:ribose transport system permease protein
VAAILVLLGFANASVFFSGLNFQNIAYDAAIPGLPAIGLALVMSTGGIDLSVGAILSLCGAVTGWMISHGQATGLAVVVGLLIGAGSGMANGMLVGVLSLPSITVTLGSMALIGGIALAIGDGTPFQITFSDSLFTAGSGVVLVVAVLCLGLVGWAVLALTPLGALMVSWGWDTAAARSSGPQVRIGLVPIYAVAGLLAAVAGMIMLGRLQEANPSSGNFVLIPAIAAAMIGGAGLLRGRPLSVPGAALGALLVGTLTNELDLAGASPYWQQVAMGAIILWALLADGIAQFLVEAP